MKCKKRSTGGGHLVACSLPTQAQPQGTRKRPHSWSAARRGATCCIQPPPWQPLRPENCGEVNAGVEVERQGCSVVWENTRAIITLRI